MAAPSTFDIIIRPSSWRWMGVQVVAVMLVLRSVDSLDSPWWPLFMLMGAVVYALAGKRAEGERIRVEPNKVDGAAVAFEAAVLLVAWPGEGIQLRLDPEKKGVKHWPRAQLEAARSYTAQVAEVLQRGVQECIVEPGGDGRIADRFIAERVLVWLRGRLSRDHPDVLAMKPASPLRLEVTLDALALPVGNGEVGLDTRSVWGVGFSIPLSEVVGVVLVLGRHWAGTEGNEEPARVEIVHVAGRQVWYEALVPRALTSVYRRDTLAGMRWMAAELDKAVDRARRRDEGASAVPDALVALQRTAHPVAVDAS